MEEIISTEYSLIEDRYSIIVETVCTENKRMDFKLTYSNDNTRVYFTNYNPDRVQLIRNSELPVWARVKLQEAGFIK